jgi:hypothetical protein
MNSNIFDLFGISNLIPNRDFCSISGSQFIENNKNLSFFEREKNIFAEISYGNIPNFLRTFVPIKITFKSNTITYLVTSDYLSIGSDEDYIRIPMTPITAQLIANKFDCSIPTKKIVDDIWKNSIHLDPKPLGPPYDLSMISLKRIDEHNKIIQNQIFEYNKLIAGHKKDVVLTNQLYPNNNNHRVAIYGWHHLDGNPIQKLNAIDHNDQYADYSHGIRLISNDVLVNATPIRIQDIFTNSELCSLISDEGMLLFQNY